MAVQAPDDRRFRRAQIRPARKRRLRAVLSWRAAGRLIAVGVLAYGGFAGVELVAGASVLQIERIVVRGNERLSTGEIGALLEGLRGQSILLADLDAFRTRLLKSPWVAEASLRRVLPSTVEAAIVERTPIGLGRVGTALYLVDARGTVIDDYGPRHLDVDLPIIDGLAGGAPDGLALDAARAELAARLLDALAADPDLSRQVSQIDVRDARNAAVILEGDSAVLQLGDGRFVERLHAYLELAPALRERVPIIDYVDLRFDERIYVRPGSDRPGRAASAPAPAVKRF
jgi:cell division protein FtsQ